MAGNTTGMIRSRVKAAPERVKAQGRLGRTRTAANVEAAIRSRLARGATSSSWMQIDRDGAGESDVAAFRVMGTIGLRVELPEDREPGLPAIPRATRMSPARTISATNEKDGGHDVSIPDPLAIYQRIGQGTGRKAA